MKLSTAAADFLLDLSRRAIEYFLETKNFLPYEKIKVPAVLEEEVNQKSGAFLVLEIIGNEQHRAYTRGESGVLENIEVLGKLVTQIAVNAAFFDANTPRLKSYELNELIIHLIIPSERKRVLPPYNKPLQGLVVESRGRVVYDLPNFLNKVEEDTEHRIRRLRLKLGLKKGSTEKDIDCFSFSVQHYKEKE